MRNQTKSEIQQNTTNHENPILESRHDTEFDFENEIHALPANPFLRVRAANDVPAADVANELPLETLPPLETQPRLARLLLPQPVPIPDPPTLPGDPWPAHGEHGALVALRGPFRLSGGWWGSRNAAPVERDYYWAEMQRGDLLWVFYDRPRRRWFWHGYAD